MFHTPLFPRHSLISPFAFLPLFCSIICLNRIPRLTPTDFHVCGSDIDIILPTWLLFLDPDPNLLSRPAQIGPKPSTPKNTPGNSHLAWNVGSAGATDATNPRKNDRALRAHSSSTVLMLENALAAMRNDASQLPLSDLIHASTMIRDLENVLREKLSRSLGGDEQMADSTGANNR